MTTAKKAASTDAMRSFWDRRARENAMWYINSQLEFTAPDAERFWASGDHDLQATLDLFGLGFTGDERVLEVGSGIGRMTRALATRAREVVGVDVSEEMVRRAADALSDVGNATVRLGNGCDLEGLDSASFDVCYSFIVFQHIPDPAVTCGYIAEMGRVLRPGGWALFQVSGRPEIHQRASSRSAQSPRARIGRLLGRRPRGLDDQRWLGSALTRAELLDALARGGLELAGSTGEGTQFHLVHARRAERPAG